MSDNMLIHPSGVSVEKILYDVEKEQRDYTGEVDEFYKTRLRSGV